MPTCTGVHVCLPCHAMHLVLLQWDHLDHQDAQGKVPARTQKGVVGGGEEEEEEDIEQLLARPV